MSIHTDNAIRVADHQYKMIERLTAQRNALLAAAKAIDAGPWLPICKEREQLRQAIAACEAQQ